MSAEMRRQMSAWRKAGVWLGLVEEDESGYSEPGYDASGYDGSAYHASGYDDGAGFDDFEDEVGDAVLPLRPRTAGRRPESSRNATSSTVRSITHPTGPAAGLGGGYPTRDSLALAPQLHLHEQATVEVPVHQRYQITTLHPTTYNEARKIGEQFRDGVPVIMNLTELAEADAKRLVDFAAGLAFGLRGSMERVTNRVFLLSPANVQVTAEDKARIAEGGFFNQS
jgi:cell division inhibitor SepF